MHISECSYNLSYLCCLVCMVQFRCALNMMLLYISAIISLEFMALSLGLRAPRMTPCPLNVRISLIVASIFHISAVYSPIGLCFGYDVRIGFCYHISRAHGRIGLGSTWAPKMTQYTLNMQISLIVASIFHNLVVLLGFVLDMMLLWVFAIITLELLTLSIG